MPDIPPLAAKMILGLAGQILDLQARLREIERELLAWHRSSDIARRLATIPGVGTVCATALAASVTDPHQFRSGRQFAAWLGLTPLQHSSGGKERLGRISKMGDKYLRRLLVVGMTSLVRRAKYKPNAVDPKLADLLSRKPVRVVTVALANKTARVIWAIMTRGGTYRAPQTAGASVS
jgi:transposase